jgi:phosphatidylglycerophosphatase A
MIISNKTKKNFITKTSIFFATGFYVGFVKYAPGTFGTLVAFIFYFFIKDLEVLEFLFFFFVLFLFSLFFIKSASKYFKEIDSGKIVLDEIIAFLPLIYIFDDNFVSLFLAFVIFRFFDIFKPYPIQIIDSKMKNSIGVILDDFVASAYTLILILIIKFYYG